MKKLTTPNGKQRKFCREYLRYHNATKAAIAAGYSHKAAAACGYNLLKQPAVQSYIGELEAEQSKHFHVTRAMIQREMWIIGTSDIADFVDADNVPKPIHEIDPELRRAIGGIRIHKTVTQKAAHYNLNFRMHDKMNALTGLSRQMGYDKHVEPEIRVIPKFIYVDVASKDPDYDKLPKKFKDHYGTPVTDENAVNGYYELLEEEAQKKREQDEQNKQNL